MISAYCSLLRTRIRLARTTLQFLVLLIALYGVASYSVAQTVRIGLSGPFTGGSSPMGESMRNGVRLAVDEINSAGGIQGVPIELIERDDNANEKVGAQIAEELTRSKVVATIGVVNTGVGLASIDHYQQARIPLVVAVSTGPMLTRKFAPLSSSQLYFSRIADAGSRGQGAGC